MGNNKIELPTENNGKWQITQTNYAVQIAQWGQGWISVLCEIPTLPYGDKEKDLATAFKICEAVNNYDKLKEDNEVLLNALKEIIDLFPENPKLPISYQVLGVANEALSKTNNLFRNEDIEAIKKAESK